MDYKLIKHPLTPTQGAASPQAKFCWGTPNPPFQEYITAIELVCQSFNTNEAEELRADIYRALRHSHPPKPNLSKEE